MEYNNKYKEDKKIVEAELQKKRQDKELELKNHYASIKYKPKIPPIATSQEGGPENLKEIGKQKLAKITAYQKSINELYMPKTSEKKKHELETIKAKLVTKPAERKPTIDYLGQVTEQEQRNRKYDETHGKK